MYLLIIHDLTNGFTNMVIKGGQYTLKLCVIIKQNKNKKLKNKKVFEFW